MVRKKLEELVINRDWCKGCGKKATTAPFFTVDEQRGEYFEEYDRLTARVTGGGK